MQRYGIVKLGYKVLEKRHNRGEEFLDYRLESIKELEALEQKKHIFSNTPCISLIMPTYNTNARALSETLQSVLKQTYSNWQLCIADGGENSVEMVVKQNMGNDQRVNYIKLKTNLGISGNSNAALDMAKGEYIGLLDHDDILEPDALYQVVDSINQFDSEIIYTDEDKTTEDLKQYFSPYYKPDFNKSLLLSNNYICHFCVIKKRIIDTIGGFRSEFDGAQDYDLFLRASEFTDKINHIPKVLYHWRVGADSTSDNPFNKEYAFYAGKRALEDYIMRNGLKKRAKVIELEDPGYFRITYTPSKKSKACILYVGENISQGNLECTHYLILEKGMKISKNWEQDLLGRAEFSKSEIVVPKIVSKGKYVYNGLAKAGNGFTWNLKGKPSWYRGRFNLGISNLDINKAPSSGILVSRKIFEKIQNNTQDEIDNTQGVFQGINIVYAPEVKIKK